jgi:hypothetical protein
LVDFHSKTDPGVSGTALLQSEVNDISYNTNLPSEQMNSTEAVSENNLNFHQESLV